MIRGLKFLSLRISRKYKKKKNQSFVSRALHSELVRWERGLVSRGVAIGLFWAFIPMPFQMIPATLFCMMSRANLPVAIVCVWLTNPITLPPIILLEYAIGKGILGLFASSQIASVLSSGGAVADLFTGALLLSCVSMVIGYVFVWFAFSYSQRRHKLQRQRIISKFSKLADAMEARKRSQQRQSAEDAARKLTAKHNIQK